MAEWDAKDLSEALRVTRRKLATLLTSASVLSVSLYVLGFIYLKTYLDVFGFQIELASLSLPNLVLAHRFFVGHHFFVGAGVFQAYFLSLFGRARLRKEILACLTLASFPLALLPAAWALAAWSEKNTPAGYNMWTPGLWLAYLSGWAVGILCFFVGRRVLQPVQRVRDSLWYPLAIYVLALTVFSYRLFAHLTAVDRLQRMDLQTVSKLVVEGGRGVPGPCAVVYVDSEMLYLLCAGERLILRKSAVSSFVVDPRVPMSPTARPGRALTSP